MNIIVCIKSVPGMITGLKIGQSRERLEPAVRSFCINETDEYALDEALVLRNRYGGQVTVLSLGPTSSEEKLQVAVAKGADKALRLDLSTDDPEITSLALSEAIRKLKFDLILSGLESSDNMAAQVGVAIAERLGIPFLFAATKIEIISGKTALVTRELGNATYQVLEIKLPALISTQTGIQKLTYAPVAKLLQAKRRGIDCIKVADLPLSQEALGKNIRNREYLEILQAGKRHTARYLEGTPEMIATEIAAKIKEVL